MRGHEVIEWEPTPQRLLIWAMRVAAFGGRPCPGLAAALVAQCGAQGPDAYRAACEAAFALARLEGTPMLRPPFVSTLSEAEAALCAMLAGAPAPWQGPGAALLGAAVRRFARAAGLSLAPYPAEASARAAS